MPTLPSGKYQLRTLHEEIALFDRKLAHLSKFETFATEAERNSSIGKMTAKRDLLIRKAQTMIDEGIEFQDSERPRYLRSEEEAAPAQQVASSDGTVAVEIVTEVVVPQPSPYAGTSLDMEQSLADYKKSRVKRKAV